MAIAARLNVGLIKISGEQRVRITEMLSAPIQEPLEGLRLRLIDHLGFAVCTICSSIFERGDDGASYDYVVRRSDDRTSKSIERAVGDDKGLMYWLLEQHVRSGNSDDTIYHRRFVCPDCLWALLGHVGGGAMDEDT